MIKPFFKFLFAKLIFGWVVAFLVILITTPILHQGHSFISLNLAKILNTKQVQPIKYKLDPSLGASEGVFVQWSPTAEVELTAYQDSHIVADALNDIAIDRQLLTYVGGWVGYSPLIVATQKQQGIWQPSIGDYKQLIYRSSTVSSIDQVIQRQFKQGTIGFDFVTSGYITAPIDPFGGLYLYASLAPEPVVAQPGDLNAIAISRFDIRSKQFLKELWAVENRYWSYTPWVTLTLAALLILAPWLYFFRVKHRWLAVLTLLVLNGALLVSFYWQMRWFYPVILPALSPFFAWAWSHKIVKQKKSFEQLQSKHLTVTNLWIEHLLDEGKPEAAFRYLKEAQGEDHDFSDIWRKVASGFERNRQFDKSIECYQSILARIPNHSEARQKVKQLKEIVDGTKTMAIAQMGGELPVGQVENLSLGRYQISSELGRGAMGIVYEAIDPKINRKVALKVVHLKSLGVEEMEGVKQRFFREAQAAGKLNHPNIVTVYDVGEEHDVAYIAMDLLKGESLSKLLHIRPIDLLKVVNWIAQAADALGYAHENEIIHRDVKPANMIVEQKSGRLKLTDFGVARIAGVQQTQTGIVLGSPSYMSPEQIRGDKLTGSTDIFSLGVTLYQCITGVLPFAGDTLPALAYGITQSKQESPRSVNPDVPVSLVRIVNKALQKDPKERFESAFDFAKSLNKWISDQGK